MTCWSCKTIKDILKCLEIENLWCNSSVCKFNRTMRRFALDTVDFEFNRVSQWITWTWDVVISTLYPVQKIIWFFWHSCCWSCLTTVPWCWQCCSDVLKQVLSQKWDAYNLKSWEYSVCWKEIHANIPQSLQWWYVVYQRWYDDFMSLDQEICLPNEMLVALEWSIQHDYSIADWDFELATFYSNMYNQTLKKILDKESTVPFSVGMWANVYNWYRK